MHMLVADSRPIVLADAVCSRKQTQIILVSSVSTASLCAVYKLSSQKQGRDNRALVGLDASRFHLHNDFPDSLYSELRCICVR